MFFVTSKGNGKIIDVTFPKTKSRGKKEIIIK
jgi:hypothetical protein